MRRDILFVRKDSNFLLNTMKKSIIDAGFHVYTSIPSTIEFDRMPELPDIYLLYLEDDLSIFNGTLKYLKKKLEQDKTKRMLFLIGTPEEIEAAYAIVPYNMVTAAFTRPVNIQEVVVTLTYFFNEGDKFGGHKHVLVVDDDSVMLRAMYNWFSPKYDVFLANSGMNAISLLAQNHIDLILLDYEMPVLSGLQVFEMLKSEPTTANIPVIFLTAKDDKDTVMKVVAARPEKYLLKTLPPEALVKALDDFFKYKK